MSGAGRVTVVNDSPEVMELLTELLRERAPYDVAQLGSDDITVRDIAESAPDLVILDLRLGSRSSGWDLLKEMRASDDDLATVPVVLCTGDVQSLREHGDELDSIADTHVLEKPFDLATFETLVERIMSEQVRQRETA